MQRLAFRFWVPSIVRNRLTPQCFTREGGGVVLHTFILSLILFVLSDSFRAPVVVFAVNVKFLTVLMLFSVSCVKYPKQHGASNASYLSDGKRGGKEWGAFCLGYGHLCATVNYLLEMGEYRRCLCCRCCTVAALQKDLRYFFCVRLLHSCARKMDGQNTHISMRGKKGEDLRDRRWVDSALSAFLAPAAGQ